LLPHLVPVLVVALATLGFAIIAWNGLPPVRILVPLLLAMLGGQLAIGALNDLVDFPEDAVGKPSKPLPSGDITTREAQAMVVAGLALMVVFGLPFGPFAIALLALGTGLGIAYDLWLKRTAWSWLPYFLALPLLPIWVFVALGRPEPRLLLLYPLGALATVGVHFAQSLPDAEIDRAAGSRSLTSRLGVEWSFLAAWCAALSAPLLAWGSANRLGIADPQQSIAVAAGFSLLLCAFNGALLLTSRRLGTRACFPLVALATLVTGLIWTIIAAR
jgi:4-hydroxybenzoate polyprenyltransferase